MPAAQYAELLDLVAVGTLDPGRLVGAVIGLEHAGAALMAMSGPPTTAGMTVVRLE
jgi:alcohol dehydrogenase